MEGQSDLERAMQHAQEMLPEVAAECVIGQLLSVRHQAQDPAVQDFVARVLDMGDWEKEQRKKALRCIAINCVATRDSDPGE